MAQIQDNDSVLREICILPKNLYYIYSFRVIKLLTMELVNYEFKAIV